MLYPGIDTHVKLLKTLMSQKKKNEGGQGFFSLVDLSEWWLSIGDIG